MPPISPPRRDIQEWHDYYKYEVPVCSYCKDPDVLRSWDSSVALCNIANYYHQRYMTDVQGAMRFMDLEIERLSGKRNLVLYHCTITNTTVWLRNIRPAVVFLQLS